MDEGGHQRIARYDLTLVSSDVWVLSQEVFVAHRRALVRSSLLRQVS